MQLVPSTSSVVCATSLSEESNPEFLQKGGTELSLMSTTGHLEVAMQYASGENSLLFKLAHEHIPRARRGRLVPLCLPERGRVSLPATHVPAADEHEARCEDACTNRR